MTEKGFVTALGTPLSREGNFLADSMVLHVEQQLTAGAAALLCMGSMGQQPYILDSQYPLVARTCTNTAAGKVPVYVGVSDVSVCRVTQRIDSLNGLSIDGVVSTAPFYYPLSQPEVIAFYWAVADKSPYPLYLYDLPVVSQTPFTAETVLALSGHPNIRGIKSANITMLRSVIRTLDDPSFSIFFSGLDFMDVALSYGLPYMLDGMFACTPVTSAAFGKCIAEGDIQGMGKCLDSILGLRDAMVRFGIWPSFTYIMNLLGYPGFFGPDYVGELTDEGLEALDKFLKEIGEL